MVCSFSMPKATINNLTTGDNFQITHGFFSKLKYTTGPRVGPTRFPLKFQKIFSLSAGTANKKKIHIHSRQQNQFKTHC